MKNKNEKAIQWLEDFSNEIELNKRAEELSQDPEVKRIITTVKQKAAEALAEWKRQNSPRVAAASQAKAGLLERFKDAVFCAYEHLEHLTSPDVVYASDTMEEPSDYPVMDLRESYGKSELNTKLPWAASHFVIFMKCPVNDEPDIVLYRALIEKRRDETGGGALYVALRVGEQLDIVRLDYNQPSRTFRQRLPANAPVSFATVLE